MNKEQYNQLNDKDRAIATECYIDGFKAAISLVESITIKDIDHHNDSGTTFLIHKDMIARIMNNQLEIFKC